MAFDNEHFNIFCWCSDMHIIHYDEMSRRKFEEFNINEWRGGGVHEWLEDRSHLGDGIPCEKVISR